MKRALMWFGLLNFLLLGAPFSQAADEPLPRVRIQTNLGDMVVELDNKKAPKTVDNFLTYVKQGSYDGTLFHRVIGDFMIQGGAYTNSYQVRPARAAIPTESNNGLKNKRGTIAMARGYDPNSATNQFFINTVNNEFLNFHAPRAGYWGYTVFGQVTEGLDVLDRISKTPTGSGGPFPKDVPRTPIIIKKISIEPVTPVLLTKNDNTDSKDGKDAVKKTSAKDSKESPKKPSESKKSATLKSADKSTSKTAAASTKAIAAKDKESTTASSRSGGTAKNTTGTASKDGQAATP